MIISRRRMLAAGIAAGLSLSPTMRALLAADEKRRFRIGACDWSIGQRQQLAALQLAKDMGA